MDKNVILEYLFILRYISYVKGALIITTSNLKKQVEDWKRDWQFVVLAWDKLTQQERNYRFKLLNEDKPRVNLRHMAHYTLLWIAYVDNYYKMHRMPKLKNKKYLDRMH